MLDAIRRLGSMPTDPALYSDTLTMTTKLRAMSGAMADAEDGEVVWAWDVPCADPDPDEEPAPARKRAAGGRK